MNTALRRSSGPNQTKKILWGAVLLGVVVSFFAFTPPPSQADTGFGWFINNYWALWSFALGLKLIMQYRIPIMVRLACILTMYFCIYAGCLLLLSDPSITSLFYRLGIPHDHNTVISAQLGVTVCWIIMTLRLFRKRRPIRQTALTQGGNATMQNADSVQERFPIPVPPIPACKFQDFGGFGSVKDEIRALINSRLNDAKYRQFGIHRNGILLHGPTGTGKSRLAECTAGEFGLRLIKLSGPSVQEKWVGSTGANIRERFQYASTQAPAVLFIDEIDALGSTRQDLSGGGDSGGGGRAHNEATIQLMECLKEYRTIPGLVLMAATNHYLTLDPAVTRDGVFDLKIRMDYPKKEDLGEILRVALRNKPWQGTSGDLAEVTRRVPQWEGAKLSALVDVAATTAIFHNRFITQDDLLRAVEQVQGQERPRYQEVSWSDLILDKKEEVELRSLIALLNAPWSQWSTESIPTGLLLLGPPGTGKSTIGRLIATQTRRAFFCITPRDIVRPDLGTSLARLSSVFQRAKQNSPAVLLFEEINAVVSKNGPLVEQFRVEFSELQQEHNVFIVGTTNHPEQIDAAMLRGGRFSEKIRIELPSPGTRYRLLQKLLMATSYDLDLKTLAFQKLAGLSQGDIEAIIKAAKRAAIGRVLQKDGSLQNVPNLLMSDFEEGIAKVRNDFLVSYIS